jgi:F0F1-type ATP synthase assembly protein I
MTAQERRTETWSGMGTGWAITSTMIAGIATCGAIGFLIDRLAGTREVFVAIGFVVGAAAAIYIVWLRYGRGEGDGT